MPMTPVKTMPHLLAIAAVLAACAAAAARAQPATAGTTAAGGAPSTDDGFTATLDSTGGIEVRHRAGAVLYRVGSSFSEPGPTFHRFGSSTASGSTASSTGWAVLASGPSVAGGVTGTARDFSVTRTITVQRHAILINDTVRANADAKMPIVGIEVSHLLEVIGGQQLREATVPGSPWTFKNHEIITVT